MAVLQRVRGIQGDIRHVDAVDLVRACSAAVHSPQVAENFLLAIAHSCALNRVNKGVFAAAGAIPLIVRAMSVDTDPETIAFACRALSSIADQHVANSDAIVLREAGVEALCVILSSSTLSRNRDVVWAACGSLWMIARSASSEVVAAMRRGRAVELLHAAKRSFPAKGFCTVVDYANDALTALEAPVSLTGIVFVLATVPPPAD